MKENIEQMRKRHEQELETLQSSCKHVKLSKWMPYIWAPGHISGDVRVCDFCGKVIKKRGMGMQNMFSKVE